MNATGEQEKAVEGLKSVSQNAKTDYKYLAELRLAGIAFQNNKVEEALATLKSIYDMDFNVQEIDGNKISIYY